MPDLTLETLPSEVIVEILCCLGSFCTLQALVNSSDIFYRLYRCYTTSISTRIAQTIVGEGVWEDAAALMVYQRQIYYPIPDCAAIQKDLQGKFVMKEDDILQFTDNQEFYESCCEDFYNWISGFRSQAPTPEPNPAALIPPPGPTATLSACSTLSQTSIASTPSSTLVGGLRISFLDEGVIPIKLFYQVWLLNIQFGYERVSTFVQRPKPTPQEATDFDIISRIMYLNRNSQAFRCSPLARWQFRQLEKPFTESWNRFWDLQSGKVIRCRFHACFGEARVLRMKMMYNLRGKTSEEDLPVVLRAFLMDFRSKVNVQTLIERYRLDDYCV